MTPTQFPGVWRPGDDPGRRKFATLAGDGGRGFSFEGGGQLAEVTVAYETWGELERDRTNAVLVLHALTGDSHAAGPVGPGHAAVGWWDGLIGPGAAIDTSRYFVVTPECARRLPRNHRAGITGPGREALWFTVPHHHHPRSGGD